MEHFSPARGGREARLYRKKKCVRGFNVYVYISPRDHIHNVKKVTVHSMLKKLLYVYTFHREITFIIMLQENKLLYVQQVHSPSSSRVRARGPASAVSSFRPPPLPRSLPPPHARALRGGSRSPGCRSRTAPPPLPPLPPSPWAAPRPVFLPSTSCSTYGRNNMSSRLVRDKKSESINFFSPLAHSGMLHPSHLLACASRRR